VGTEETKKGREKVKCSKQIEEIIKMVRNNSVLIKIKRVSVVSMLVSVLEVRGFKLDRGGWIFKGDKNPYHDFLRRGSKAVGPMLQDFSTR
jgi:hypothetical protein